MANFLKHSDSILLYLFIVFIYIYTAPPSVFLGDSGDMTAAAALFGVAHDPGYPLYSFLGFIWTKVFSFGTIAWRMNVFSALWAAGGVVLVYMLVKYVTKNALAAFVGATVLAFSSTYWLFGTTAEVFSMHAFLSLLFLYALVRFYFEHGKRYIYLAAFAFSLSIAHHHTIILWLPGALVLLVASQFWKHLRLRDIVTAGAITLSGLLWYLYLPFSQWVSGQYYWHDGNSIRGIADIFLRKSYGTFDIQRGGAVLEGGERVRYLPIYGMLFLYNFSVIGGLVAVIGGLWGFVKQRVVATALLLNFFVSGLFFLAYAGLQLAGLFRLGMIEKFSVMSFCIVAIFIGLGADWLMTNGAIQRFFSKLRLRNAHLFLNGIVVLIPLYLLINHWSVLNLRDYWGGWAIGQDIFINVTPRAVLRVVGDTMTFNARYLADVEGVRDDVFIVSSPLPPVTARLEQFVHDAELVSTKPSDDPQFVSELVELNYQRVPWFQGVRPQNSPEGTFFHPSGMTMQLFEDDEFDPEAQIHRLRYFLNNSFFLNHVYGKDTTLPAYARSINTDYAITLSNIGWFMIAYGERSDAKSVFELGKELGSNLVSHYIGLSFISRQEGRCDESLAILDSFPSKDGEYNYELLHEKRMLYEQCYRDPEKVREISNLIEEQFGATNDQ